MPPTNTSIVSAEEIERKKAVKSINLSVDDEIKLAAIDGLVLKDKKVLNENSKIRKQLDTETITHPITSRIKKLLMVQLPNGLCLADCFAMMAVDEAVTRRNFKAMNMLIERVEGKVTQGIKIEQTELPEIDYSKLSDEQLQQLKQILEIAGATK